MITHKEGRADTPIELKPLPETTQRIRIKSKGIYQPNVISTSHGDMASEVSDVISFRDIYQLIV